MELLTDDEIKGLNFSDCIIDFFEWQGDSSCMIKTQGVFLEKDEGVIEFSNCNLHIMFVNDFIAQYYDHVLKKWFTCVVKEDLKEICEFVFDDDLIIRGFGKDSGMWLELKFISPKEVYAEIN